VSIEGKGNTENLAADFVFGDDQKELSLPLIERLFSIS